MKTLLSIEAHGLAHHIEGTVQVPQPLDNPKSQTKLSPAHKTKPATPDKIEAAVAKLPSVGAILTNAAIQGWEIHQIDVKNARLNTELTETIYICPLPRYLKPGQEGKVCRLIKCLYGTQQARFEWYKTLHEFFSKIRFTCSAVDHAVFFRHEREHFSSVISVSMDNMVITGNSIKTINWIKGEFKKRFEISDLGEIKWLLGLEVNYNKDVWTLSISQGAYVNKLVEYFSLESENSVSTPLEPGATLSMS